MLFKRKNKDRVGHCPKCYSEVHYKGVKLVPLSTYIPNFKIDDIQLINCMVCREPLYVVRRR